MEAAGRGLSDRCGQPRVAPATHHTENTEKTLDPPVAILEHANRIIETAVGLYTNLDRHGFSSPFFPVSLIVVHLRRPGGHEVLLLFSFAVLVAHSPSEHRSSTALLRADYRSEHVRALAIHHRFFEFAGPALSLKLRYISQIAEQR